MSDVLVTIYLATNSANGKQYVGKTRHSIAHRWSVHCGASRGGSALAFHRAIRKYGEAAFVLSCLESCSVAEADEAERKWIVALGTLAPMGYNLTHGGEGGIPCAEVLAARSETTKSSWANPDIRARRLLAQRAVMDTEAYREKHRKITSSKWADPEERAKKMAGRDNPEVRRKIGEASVRMWNDPKTRERLLNTLRSPESRAGISQRILERLKNPEYRAKHKAILQSEEYKAKMSAVVKSRWADPLYREKMTAAFHNSGKMGRPKKAKP